MDASSLKPLVLFHGSPVRVEQPLHGFGSPYNDYGLGFYCTESRNLACEWACPDTSGGYVNEYTLNKAELRILDLSAPEYTCLQWLAILVANRRFDATTPLMVEAIDFILSEYLIDTHVFDVVYGYRADDSYFSFARAFLDNRLSLKQLEYALYLGELGTQFVLKSPKAFNALSYIAAEPVSGSTWHPQRRARDDEARNDYGAMMKTSAAAKNETFILDLLRKAT